MGDISKTYCIGVVKDEDLTAFISSPDIVEILKQEAETLGAVWRPQVTKITDENKILDILDKVHNSQGLTQLEKDVINPDNAELGINKSTAFTDMLNDAIGAINNG